MAYTKPDEGDTILHTHITQLTNALDGTADAGEPIQATEVDDATHYAVDARNKNATGLHFRLRNTAGEDMLVAALSTLTLSKNIVVAATVTFDGVDVGAHTHDGSDSQPLAANSVNATMIAAGAVGTSEMATGSVNATIIAAGAVGSSELASAAATSIHIADGAIITAKLRDSYPASVLGRATGTGYGPPEDIRADTEYRVLSRRGGTLAFRQVSAGMVENDAMDSQHYAADSIDEEHLAANSVNATAIKAGAVGTSELAADSVNGTIVGNRVPQLYRRQGGSATHWATAGATTVNPTMVRMQCGAIEWTGGATSLGTKQVTLPEPYRYAPIVIACAATSDINASYDGYGSSDTDIETITLGWKSISGAALTSVTLFWQAIGPE